MTTCLHSKMFILKQRALYSEYTTRLAAHFLMAGPGRSWLESCPLGKLFGPGALRQGSQRENITHEARQAESWPENSTALLAIPKGITALAPLQQASCPLNSICSLRAFWWGIKTYYISHVTCSRELRC